MRSQPWGLPDAVQYQEVPLLLRVELQARRRQIARQQEQINRLTRGGGAADRQGGRRDSKQS